MRFVYLILTLLSIVAFVRGGEKKKNVCNLPLMIGNTKANIKRFYFSKNVNKCLEFGYGGSGGNGNNFKTLKACNMKCICGLPVKKGQGMALNDRWYFNKKKNACIKFNFGGGKGNANNFMSRNKCLNTCRENADGNTGVEEPSKGGKKSKGGKRSTTRKPCTGGKNVCTLPMKKGKGKGNHKRWYYNGQVCKKFNFKGRKGNANNFKSEKECREVCVDGNSSGGKPSATRQPSTGGENVCKLSKEVGKGKASHLRWHYDGEKCEMFYFRGGKGNGNNFMSRKECRKACVNGNSNGGKPSKPTRKPSTGGEHVCKLEMNKGNGKARKQRYYFNQKQQRCRKFYYGGQGGNGNNFENLKACNMECVCGQPMRPGNVSRKQARWYYNKKQKKCEQFKYGGKDGNANNFKNRKACSKACLKKKEG